MSFYEECKYADRTKFGLICDYSTGHILKNEEYSCPKDSGTDRKRNGICYSFCMFDKNKNK